MTIQMIGRHIQRRADVRAKCFGGFQLKTRKLQHVPLSGARSLHHRRRRRADVAADLRRDTALLEDMAGERRGRGFAVRTRDADDLALQETSSPVPDRRSRARPGAGPLENSQIRGNAGR